MRESEPLAAWPIVTYGDSLTMHVNGEDIEIIKVPPAHTDGDSIVYFKNANVLHLGDIFRTGAFPVIDTQNGGTAQGTVEALQFAFEQFAADGIHGVDETRVGTLDDPELGQQQQRRVQVVGAIERRDQRAALRVPCAREDGLAHVVGPLAPERRLARQSQPWRNARQAITARP